MVREIADATGFDYQVIKRLLRKYKIRKPPALHQQNKQRGVEEKYGVGNVFQDNYIKEKSRESVFQKYGVEFISQSPEIQKQCRITSLKNWGTPHHFQSNKFWKQGTHYQWKDYVWPSGRISKIQGYEGRAIDVLLEDYAEGDIVTDDFNMPYIWYEWEGKRRRYFPDIYIPNETRIIEVKSKYTYNAQLEQNLIKQDAAIQAGYAHEFMVFD